MLSFIARVDCADVSPHDSEGLLPGDGLLSFFYDAVTQQAWGFDPADRGSAVVTYTPATVGTQRREPPAELPSDGVFTTIGLRPRADITLRPGSRASWKPST